MLVSTRRMKCPLGTVGFLCTLTTVAEAFLKPSPRVALSRRLPQRGPTMSGDTGCLTVTVERGTVSAGVYTLRVAYYGKAVESPDTWTVKRAYSEVERFSETMQREVGFVLPPLPPLSVVSSNPLALEEYLNRVVQVTAATDKAPLLRLLGVPSDVGEEWGVPTYTPEVLREGGGIGEGREREREEVSNGAAAAAALAGFVFGGPVGAIVAGVAGKVAAGRDDRAGELARTVGKGLNVGLKQADRLNKQYGITEKAKEALDKGIQAANRAIDNLDDN